MEGNGGDALVRPTVLEFGLVLLDFGRHEILLEVAPRSLEVVVQLYSEALIALLVRGILVQRRAVVEVLRRIIRVPQGHSEVAAVDVASS